MKIRQFAESLAMIETWSAEAQHELALALDARVKEYRPTPDEPAGIDRDLRAAPEGRLGSDAQVDAALNKFRPA